MTGATKAADLDAALQGMACSQHTLIEQIAPIREGIHACTDITGFGLLGHLGEMLQNKSGLNVQLDGSAIPAYPGALELFERGVSSTLAPSNRAAWQWLEGPVRSSSPISSPAGAAGGPADLRPAAAGLQQGSHAAAHSERPVDSDRQRNSRA